MKYQPSSLALLSLFAAATASSYADMDIRREFPSLNLLQTRQLTNLQVRCPPSFPLPQLTTPPTFTSSLGGAAAPPITNTLDPKRPFLVGSSTFPDFATAANRSCDDQHNLCANIANNKALANGLRVADCDAQATACKAAQKSATVTAFAVKASSDAVFDYFCDP